MRIVKQKEGFTLIEVIIYLALFTLLLGAGIVSAFYIIDAAERDKYEASANAEAQFLLRKIDWALTGVSAINSPPSAGSSDVLSVDKADFTDNPLIIDSLFGRARMKRGTEGPRFLTAGRVSIENLTFEHVAPEGGKPAAIKAFFTANAKLFEFVKYLRK